MSHPRIRNTGRTRKRGDDLRADWPQIMSTRCSFAKTASVWRLADHCETTTTIELPPGVALDGQGKTIALAGDPEGFESVGVRVNGATAHDVTINGSRLAAGCPRHLAGLVVSGPGKIEHVTVCNVRFGAGCPAGVGIEIGVFDGDAVDLRNVTITNAGTGMLLTGDGRVSVASCTVRCANTAIQVMNTLEAVITEVATEDVGSGVFVTGRPRAKPRGTARPGRLAVITAIDKGMATTGNRSQSGPSLRSTAGPAAPSAAVAPVIPLSRPGRRR